MRTRTKTTTAGPRGLGEPGREADRDLLLALYQEEREGMVRLARLLTGSVVIAEDVVQDAFVQLYDRGLGAVDQPGAYLRRTVVNLCRSHHRRKGVETRWRARQPPPQVELPPELDEMRRALSTLADRQREALVLRFYLDLKVEDVAALLDRPAGTVKSDIHRGLAALTEEITR